MKQTMKSIFILALILTACVPTRKHEIFMTDSDYAEFDRQYSPDSSKILLNYGVDLGAFGYGKAEKAVLNLADTTKNLREYTINQPLTRVKWTSNESISGSIDIIPFIRSGEKYELKNENIDGVEVIVTPYDFIEQDFKQMIEFREISPNQKYELVAYRYCKSRSALNFIHVSIIEKGQEIPKYGNYLIADMQSDYVFDGGWTRDNKLTFYTNELYADMVQYYLVENRPNIEYELKVDKDKFGSKYRWMKKGSS
jgi:hypothetical protein